MNEKQTASAQVQEQTKKELTGHQRLLLIGIALAAIVMLTAILLYYSS